jgi:predicted amidophosphoribosyltransferase
MSLLHEVYNFFLDLVFPSNCALCDKFDRGICRECFSKIPYQKRIFETDDTQVTYFFDFKNPQVHHALWQAKYHHHTDILKVFGEFLGHELEKDFDKKETFIIPIPLSKRDVRLHNHTQILAEATGFPILDILEKKTTTKQAHLEHRKEREENVQGKILLNNKKLEKFLKKNNLQKEDLAKLKFILLDDTVTTGSTLLEAKRVLVSSGFSNLKIYTLTH